MVHTRLHSNTVSNDRPPEINTSLRSIRHRSNSEGSPGVSPDSPTTPLDYNKNDDLHAHLRLEHFPDSKNRTAIDSQTNTGMTKTSSSQSLPTPVAAPEVPYEETGGGRINVIPKKAAARSRKSSQASNTKMTPMTSTTANTTDTHSNNTSENESSNHSVMKNASRRGSDGTEGSTSEGEHSIATAMHRESTSKKRNQEFHALFRNLPEDDALIEDYGCALQKEVLVQGRIYISENHLCFNANIFGWVTNFVIAFSDVVDIEKRTTAIFIPNAIQVSTLHAKYTFASFLSRDQAFDLMVDVWRYSRPLVNRSSDTSPKDTLSGQNDDEEQGSDFDDGDEDTTDIDDSECSFSGTETEQGDSNPPSPVPSKNLPPKDDTRQPMASSATKNGDNNNEASNKPAQSTHSVKSAPAAQSSQTKQTKEKTECTCADTGEHYPNVVSDQVYQGSIEMIQNLLYTSGFMKQFLAENEKATDVNLGEWNKSEETKKQTRKSSYIKQLNGSIGPKQTQCLITEEVLHSDMEQSFTMLTTTQTPDVPSGNSFSVKTRTCLTWASFGKVRMLVTATVDFAKSSWLKSTIDKASIDGQVTYYKHLDTAIRQYMKKHPSEFSIDGTHYERRKKKGKKHHRKHRRDVDAKHRNEKPIDQSGIKATVTRFLNMVVEGCNASKDILGTIFTTSRLTLFCLAVMVCINLYTAWKMKDVEYHLQGAGNDIGVATNGDHAHHSIEKSLERMYHDELWEWLKTLDIDHEPNYNDNIDSSSTDDDDTNISTDQQILALAKIVRRAETNIGQVSRVMEKYRRRIEQKSP